MPDTQVPCPIYALPVVAHEEPQRRATYIQAALLERAELKRSGDEERHRADEPGMKGQPGPQGYQTMDERVSEKGPCSKARPDHGIASQERQGDRDGPCLSSTGIYHQVDHGHAG